MPRGAKQIHGFAEYVIVDEASVDREQSHQKDHIASGEEHLEDLNEFTE
jgi:hypothetical protein